MQSTQEKTKNKTLKTEREKQSPKLPLPPPNPLFYTGRLGNNHQQPIRTRLNPCTC